MDNFYLDRTPNPNGLGQLWTVSWRYNDCSFVTEIDVSHGDMFHRTFVWVDGDRWGCETKEEREARHLTYLQNMGGELPEDIDNAFAIWLPGALRFRDQAIERFKAIQYIINLSI
jgi:hypothetical protein